MWEDIGSLLWHKGILPGLLVYLPFQIRRRPHEFKWRALIGWKLSMAYSLMHVFVCLQQKGHLRMVYAVFETFKVNELCILIRTIPLPRRSKLPPPCLLFNCSSLALSLCFYCLLFSFSFLSTSLLMFHLVTCSCVLCCHFSLQERLC